MKGSGREGKGPPSADLLICFPSRSHFALMPKPICSPARACEMGSCNGHRRQQLRKSGSRYGGRASPLLWAKARPNNVDISEPTSPKVTCAGQIKVRPKNTCKNWESVMDEIERLHNSKKQRKRAAWIEALGFKKDVMQFLTCLRSLRFHFRCFGAFPSADISSDEDDDDDDDENEPDQFENGIFIDKERKLQTEENNYAENEDSRTVFSKWFMILQEDNRRNEPGIYQENRRKTIKSLFDEEVAGGEDAPCVPPSNALLLMRCRSAPAKSWQEEKEEERSESDEEKRVACEKAAAKEDQERNEGLADMAYESDFSRFSSEIAKETWVVDGIRHLLARSRSWKR